MWRSGRRRPHQHLRPVSERHITGIATKYDYRDAEGRAETLREWAAQEPDADQYELPDVEGSIPPSMRQAVLNDGEVAHLVDRINDPITKKLVNAVIALDHLSAQTERPELDDNIRQELS